MNENELKKDAVQSDDLTAKHTPLPDNNTEEYSDLDIFDFDAHRKAKSEENIQDRSDMANLGNQNQFANHVNAELQNKSITDVPAKKVVYNSSNGQRRTPVVPKIPKDKKEKRIKPMKPIVDDARPNVGLILAKSLIYIAVVLLISCLCAYYVIVISNDVFAFVKSDTTTEVSIPEYATLKQIADELHEKDVIKYPKIFVLYTMIKGNNSGKYLSGTFSVSPSQNYDELLSTFIAKKDYTLTEVIVTIPEGYTVDDIIKLLVEEKGIGTKEGFIDAIQNGEYDYWFVKELTDLNPNRKYRLEGYLYPDTYYFYKESDETVIINKMLKNFHSKFNIQYKQECDKAGMSVDDVVNLASIIQMEAKYNVDYTNVSSVLHNRLNSSYYMRRLDCDSTIQYLLEERVEELTHEHTLIEHPYNTYKNSGLPPGPISNPTLKAIRAALYPEKTSYYFFVSNVKGYMLYGKNLTEHNANIATVRAESEALKKNDD